MRDPDGARAELLLPGDALAPRRRLLLGALGELRRRRSGDPAPTRTAASEEQAARDLERLQCEARLGAVEELLAAYLGAAMPAEAFAHWRLGPERAVRAWAALAAADATVPHVPMPGESSFAVARRLHAELQRHRRDDPRTHLWGVRIAHAGAGPAEAERQLLRHLPPAAELRRASTAAAFLAERVELALSRGAPARALAELERAAVLVARTPLLGRLYALAQAALGRWDETREAQGPAPSGGWALPSPLARLRALAPWTAPWLPGRAAGAECAAPREERGSRQRAGAALFAVFAFDSGGQPRALVVDGAPGLRAGIDTWVSQRRRAWNAPGAPEREIALEPRARLWHRRREEGSGPPGPWRHCASSARVRALVLEPVLDGRRELAGWLWIEFEHHLVPAPATLAAWARAVRDEVALAARTEWTTDPGGDFAAGPLALAVGEPTTPPFSPFERDPRAQFARALVPSLGLKLAQRHWWYAVAEGATARPVAEGGAALGEGRPRFDGPAFERTRRTGAALVHQDPDPVLAPHPAAASGLVLPVAIGPLFLGWLVLCSARRRDFSTADVARIEERLAERAPDALFAQLAARDGGDGNDQEPCVPPPGPARAWADELSRAAAAPRVLAAIGPPGSGTTTLVRWCLYLREPDADLAPAICGVGQFESALALARRAPRALVLEHFDRWPEAEQARVLAALDRGELAPRQVAITLGERLERCVPEGRVPAGFAARWAGYELHTRPLAAERAHLLELVAARIAAEALAAGEPEPQLDDGALALLWRLDYPDNLRGLGALARALVLRFAGESVDSAQLTELLEKRGVAPRLAFPKRNLPPGLLEAAVAATRTGTGRVNKVRAARYLGWDPDTLALRLARAGIDETAS
ncbi:MAG: hypothetical protein GC161_13705 [Planctomycetaceae bacterium]|nr:hypothetical protein [Planctomycetaceae bacterium]